MNFTSSPAPSESSRRLFGQVLALDSPGARLPELPPAPRARGRANLRQLSRVGIRGGIDGAPRPRHRSSHRRATRSRSLLGGGASMSSRCRGLVRRRATTGRCRSGPTWDGVSCRAPCWSSWSSASLLRHHPDGPRRSGTVSLRGPVRERGDARRDPAAVGTGPAGVGAIPRVRAERGARRSRLLHAESRAGQLHAEAHRAQHPLAHGAEVSSWPRWSACCSASPAPAA